MLCGTIRRFECLERPAIILLERSTDDTKMLDRLLYVGGSWAQRVRVWQAR
jgi:hypothetical protein